MPCPKVRQAFVTTIQNVIIPGQDLEEEQEEEDTKPEEEETAPEPGSTLDYHRFSTFQNIFVKNLQTLIHPGLPQVFQHLFTQVR